MWESMAGGNNCLKLLLDYKAAYGVLEITMTFTEYKAIK